MTEPASGTLVVFAPGAFDDPDPAETARRRLVLATTAPADALLGILGVGRAGLDALALAARVPSVPRVVLVNVPFAPDAVDVDLADVHARVLLLYGARDTQTGSAHGRRWQKTLPHARLEMVPDGGAELVERLWPRILSHVAPGRTRAG